MAKTRTGLGISLWLFDHFAVDVPISAQACLTPGFSEDVDGQTITREGFWFPRLVALPTG